MLGVSLNLYNPNLIYKQKNMAQLALSSKSEVFPIAQIDFKGNKLNVPQKNIISFSSKKSLSDEDKSYCHLVIHGTALACTAISAAHADASAWGFDAWALRGAQGLMFTLLADRLDAPAGASMIYGTKEFYSGASIGIGLSKALVGTAGIAAHGASIASGTSATTGGTSHAAISGTVGAVNGGLSGIITEKMGWGFVKRVNQNKMNLKDQLSEAGTYAVARGITKFGLDGIDSLHDASGESIKSLIENCPEGSRAFLGCMYEMIHETGADTYAGMFLVNLGTRFGTELLATKGNLTQEQKWGIIKDSIINTAAFVASDRLIEQGANEKVIAERQRIEQTLNSAPEALQGFMRQVKYSDLNDLMEPTRDTLNRFKNKDDLNALTDTIKGLTGQLDIAMVEAEKSFEEAKQRKIEQQKTDIKEKQIKPKFIDLVQREKEGKQVNIPNCVMIAGSNPDINRELIEWTGKNSNCHFVQVKHTDNLLAKLKEAESRHEETGNRTLIHVDGFEQLLDHKLTPEKKIESLKSIMSDTSEKYHSTIIFSAIKSEKLDQIALQPHRVEKINASIKD